MINKILLESGIVKKIPQYEASDIEAKEKSKQFSLWVKPLSEKLKKEVKDLQNSVPRERRHETVDPFFREVGELPGNQVVPIGGCSLFGGIQAKGIPAEGRKCEQRQAQHGPLGHLGQSPSHVAANPLALPSRGGEPPGANRGGHG